jgi:hypothetical protein
MERATRENAPALALTAKFSTGWIAGCTVFEITGARKSLPRRTLTARSGSVCQQIVQHGYAAVLALRAARLYDLIRQFRDRLLLLIF